MGQLYIVENTSKKRRTAMRRREEKRNEEVRKEAVTMTMEEAVLAVQQGNADKVKEAVKLYGKEAVKEAVLDALKAVQDSLEAARREEADVNELMSLTATKQPTSTLYDLTVARKQTSQGTAISAVALMLFPDKGRVCKAYNAADHHIIADTIAADIKAGGAWACVGRSRNTAKDWINDGRNLASLIYARACMHIRDGRETSGLFSAPVM